ncbi:hypothetical protein CLOP_g5497, partial [Closterium sp. NIES-67]
LRRNAVRAPSCCALDTCDEGKSHASGLCPSTQAADTGQPGPGEHPAVQALKDVEKGSVNISVNMRPLLCALRVGVSVLSSTEMLATPDDVLYFLAEAAPNATKRLIEAAMSADPESAGSQAAKMVDMHRKAYGRTFKKRVAGGYERVADLL